MNKINTIQKIHEIFKNEPRNYYHKVIQPGIKKGTHDSRGYRKTKKRSVQIGYIDGIKTFEIRR